VPSALSEQYDDVDLWAGHETFHGCHALVAPILRTNGEGECSFIERGSQRMRATFTGCLGPFGRRTVQLSRLALDRHLHKCGVDSDPCKKRGVAYPELPNCISRVGYAQWRPQFIQCFDMAAASVAFRGFGEGIGAAVWLTPLALYALLTGRCVVADYCPAHTYPFDPAERAQYASDAAYHIFRAFEWRLLMRIDKYTRRYGYSLVRRGLMCVRETDAATALEPLTLAWDNTDGYDAADSVAGFAALGLFACARHSGSPWPVPMVDLASML
jgi:hypothetical protein